MRLFLALAFTLVTPLDAAACHRFSHWRYPRPQRCEAHARTAVIVSREKAAIQLPAEPASHRELRLRLLVRGGLEPDDILLSRAREIIE